MGNMMDYNTNEYDQLRGEYLKVAAATDMP